MVHIITYDLRKPGQNYEALLKRLRERGAVRLLESVWIQSSVETPASVRDDLVKFIDTNDRLLVAEVKNNAAWRNLMVSDAEVKTIFAKAR